MKQLFFFAAIALLCFSCASEMPDMPAQTETATPKTNLEYALEHVEKLMDQIDPSTRATRRIPDVQFVCSETTRSGEQDTLLYLVNYAGNTGFALLDAEAKNGGVYAISPKGHLEFSDSIDNPTLAYFFRKVKEVSSVRESATRGDIIVVGWAKTTEMITHRGGPILCSTFAGWRNDNVTSAAIAIAKMLAYYRTTNKINGTSFNWADILYNDQDAVEDYLYLLNDKSFLGDIDATSGKDPLGRRVTPDNVVAALQKLGLGNGDTEPAFNGHEEGSPLSNPYSDCKLKLLLGSDALYSPRLPDGPVICYANPYDSISDITYDYLQYWIVDGFIDRHKYAVNGLQIGADLGPLPTLYRCIWGKRKYTNGYYAYTFDNMIDNSEARHPVDSTGEINKNKLVFIERPEQFMFPYTGVIGGFNKKAPAQP